MLDVKARGCGDQAITLGDANYAFDNLFLVCM